MKDIAVEKGLSDVSGYLKQNGYQVSEVDVHKKSNRDLIESFDVVVLAEMDNDFMVIEDTSTNAPVIIAAGLRPEDIQAQIESIPGSN